MNIMVPVQNYWAFLSCLLSYLREVRTLSFDEAHARRAHWAQEVLNRCGVTFDVVNPEGLMMDKSCVYVANHAALIDALIMCSALPRDVRFLAKKEIFNVPGLRKALLLEKHIPVYRGAKDSSHIEKLKKAVAEAFADGGAVMFFPEGTRTRTGELNPFKLGAFYNAVQNNVPVVPIALDGPFKLNPKTSNHIEPGHVTVYVLNAIEVPTEGDEKERAQKMCDQARKAIEDCLKSNHS